jgi:hypothetical protein
MFHPSVIGEGKLKRISSQASALLLLFFSTMTAAAVAQQPESLPRISFFPHEIYLDEQTSSFTVSVNIENLQASHRLVGFSFRLEYDPSIMSFVGMVDGDLLKDFDKYILISSEMGFPIIGILLLPPYTRFPEGNGTIAALSFAVAVLADTTIHLTSEAVDAETKALPQQDDYSQARGTWNRADLNFDGKVDLLDLSVFAKAFASRLGQYRWNTNVDIDRNQMIDIIDAVKISKDFGKTRPP